MLSGSRLPFDSYRWSIHLYLIDSEEIYSSLIGSEKPTPLLLYQPLHGTELALSPSTGPDHVRKYTAECDPVLNPSSPVIRA